MRILTLTGTRPGIIKLFPVYHALKRQPDVQVHLCVSGQHRDMLDQFLTLADLHPDSDLDVMEINQSLTTIAAKVMTRISGVFDEFRPHRVVVQGDTTTALAGALAAHYKQIPVSHIEAGLRTGNLYAPWPEEANRVLIDRLADQLFAPTPLARQALLAEGVAEEMIHVTGNTVIDTLFHFRNRITHEEALRQSLDERFAFLPHDKSLILVTCHRRENYYDGGIEGICNALLAIANRQDVHLIFPVHPNPKVRQPIEAMLGDHPHISLCDPQDYVSFIYLMLRSRFLISDSGGVQEEAPALGRPVVVMREVTERPEALSSGNIILTGTDAARIITAATHLLDDDATYKKMSQPTTVFGDGQAGERIATILRQAVQRPNTLLTG